MKLGYIVVGILIVSAGVFLTGFTIHWPNWGIPLAIEIRPFTAFAPVFYVVGGIVFAFGLTERTSLRLFLMVIVIVTVILITKTSLPLIVT